MTRKPFLKKTVHRSDGILDLIHSDLSSNKRYILTFIDDCSRFCVVYFLENKSDVKTYDQKTPKVLRTDIGGEFISSEIKKVMIHEGYQTTAPYTQQQCGRT